MKIPVFDRLKDLFKSTCSFLDSCFLKLGIADASMRKSLIYITFILALIILWMASGVFKSHQDESIPASKQAKIHIENSTAKLQPLKLKLNGVLKAYKTVVLKPEIDGKITQVSVRNGQFLKRGEIIAYIDVENRKKLLEQANIELENARLTFKSAQQLYDKNLSSENAYSIAKSTLKASEANLERAQKEFEKTRIVAPFDGYIDLINVYEGDFASIMQNTEIATFNMLDPILAAVDVPQSKIDMVKQCSRAEVTIDNQSYIGKINFISQAADPSTRTFRVEVLLDNPESKLKIAQSVNIMFETDHSVSIQYVPKSALLLDKDGRVSLKIVDDKSIVKSIPVEILDENDNTFGVYGLPHQAKIVFSGGAFILDGEKVEY